MYTYDVFITVRQKSRQSTICIVIKGIEKYITNVYEARHQLLKLNGPRLLPNIPSSYFISEERTQEHVQNSLISLLRNEENLYKSSTLPMSTWLSPPQKTSVDFGYRQSFLPYFTFSPTNSSSMPDISSTEVNDVQNIFSNLSVGIKSSSISPKNSSDIQSSGYHSMNCSFISLGNPSIESMNESSPNALWKKRRSIDVPYHDSYDHKHEKLSQTYNQHIISKYNAISPKKEKRATNSYWQGLGLSQTSPTPISQSLSTNIEWSDNKMTKKSEKHHAIINAQNKKAPLMQYNDVSSILAFLGLEHHICKYSNLISFNLN